jgi:hypothetical protein
MSQIDTAMDNDAGGNDDIGASVAQSISMAMGRREELASDTHGQGTVLGDLLPGIPAFSQPDETVLSAIPELPQD